MDCPRCGAAMDKKEVPEKMKKSMERRLEMIRIRQRHHPALQSMEERLKETNIWICPDCGKMKRIKNN